MNAKILTCPSCGSETLGPYCHQCSEKVKVNKDEMNVSFFLKDAFEELFNFDSKFIKTLRYLVFRPGFLTKEILAGRRINYIKPFRLYTIFIVVHFLAFSFFKSGDIFSIDRMPLFKIIPGVHRVIESYETKSGMMHDVFAQSVNQKLKDNLNIIFYFLVFVLAAFVKVVFYRDGRYYVEYLYYMLHLISFGLLRNILLIPLVVFDLIPIAFVLAAVTQFVYTWLSIKNVYRESNGKTLVRLFVVMFGFLLVFMPAITLSLLLAMLQTT